MTARYRYTVIRPGRRQRYEADAEDRMHGIVGNVCGLGEDTVRFAPPSTQIGWMEPGKVGGGLVFCLTCFPQLPTAYHIQVYTQSYFATRDCTRCGRRLDTVSQ